MRDSFIVFRNWVDAINSLPEEYQLETYKALAHYGITGEIPQGLSPIANAILLSFSVSMEKNIKRYNASVENGKKGGRPKKEQPNCENENLEKPSETQTNLEKPTHNLSITQENLTEPTHNLYDNVNDNYLLVNNKNNIYINSACTHACVSDNSYLQKCFKTFFSEVFDYCVTDKFLIPANEIIDVMVGAYQQAQAPNGFKFNHTTYNENALLDVFIKVDAYNFRSIINQLVFNESIENRTLYIMGCLIMASQDNKCANTPEQIEVLRKALTSMPHTDGTVNQQVQSAPETMSGD